MSRLTQTAAAKLLAVSAEPLASPARSLPASAKLLTAGGEGSPASAVPGAEAVARAVPGRSNAAGAAGFLSPLPPPRGPHPQYREFALPGLSKRLAVVN